MPLVRANKSRLKQKLGDATAVTARAGEGREIKHADWLAWPMLLTFYLGDYYANYVDKEA